MSEQKDGTGTPSRGTTIIGLLKDLFLLLVSASALAISYTDLVQNMPENKLRREQDALMKEICGRAYIVSNELDSNRAERRVSKHPLPSAFESLKRNSSLLIAGIDEGIDLALYDEILGVSKNRFVAFSATQHQLHRVLSAVSLDDLGKLNDAIYIDAAVVRILDRCLSYEPSVFTDQVRKKIILKYNDEARSDAWNHLVKVESEIDKED